MAATHETMRVFRMTPAAMFPVTFLSQLDQIAVMAKMGVSSDRLFDTIEHALCVLPSADRK